MGTSMNRRQWLRLLGATAAVSAAGGLAGCAARGGKDADVIVLGAGISGLYSAMLLEEAGFRVLLLEANQRTGGRIFTLETVDGRPEAGGFEVGPMYARVLAQVERFGLGLHGWIGDSIRYALHIQDRLMPASAWQDAGENRLAGEFRARPPFALASALLPERSPLAGLESWVDPEVARRWDLPYGQYLRDRGADEAALSLLSVGLAADEVDDMSLLWILRQQKVREFSRGAGALQFIDGGMTRLISAMEGSLHGDLELGCPVEAIESGAGGAEVRCAGGRRYRADYVVSTLPLTVLRDIAIHPGMPEVQRAAVANIPYGHGTSVFLPVREPYWEEDGLPPSIWSDGMLPRVMKWQSQAGEYLWVYLSGIANDFCRHNPDDVVLEQVMQELVRIRPSTAGRVEPGAVMCWSKHPWVRGTFAYRGPGDVRRYGEAAATPHGRVHFAGEHTSVLSMGLEGAMESAERTAFEILERAG